MSRSSSWITQGAWMDSQRDRELEEFSSEELAEFLEADDAADVYADPAFKERLRETLWNLVVDLAEARRRGPGHS